MFILRVRILLDLTQLVGQRVMRQLDSSLSTEIIEVLLAGRVLVIDEVGDCVRVLRRLDQRGALQVAVLDGLLRLLVHRSSHLLLLDWLSLVVMVRQRLELHGRLLRLLMLDLVLQVKVDPIAWVALDLTEHLVGQRQILVLDLRLSVRIALLHSVLWLVVGGLLNGILALGVLHWLLDGVLLLSLDWDVLHHLGGIRFIAWRHDLLLFGVQVADTLKALLILNVYRLVHDSALNQLLSDREESVLEAWVVEHLVAVLVWLTLKLLGVVLRRSLKLGLL